MHTAASSSLTFVDYRELPPAKTTPKAPRTGKLKKPQIERLQTHFHTYRVYQAHVHVPMSTVSLSCAANRHSCVLRTPYPDWKTCTTGAYPLGVEPWAVGENVWGWESLHAVSDLDRRVPPVDRYVRTSERGAEANATPAPRTLSKGALEALWPSAPGGCHGAPGAPEVQSPLRVNVGSTPVDRGAGTGQGKLVVSSFRSARFYRTWNRPDPLT